MEDWGTILLIVALLGIPFGWRALRRHRHHVRQLELANKVANRAITYLLARDDVRH